MVKFRYSFYNEVEFTCFNSCCCNKSSLKEFFTLKVSYYFKKLLTTRLLQVQASVGISKCLHDCENDIAPLIKAWGSLIDKIVRDLLVETHSLNGYD